VLARSDAPQIDGFGVVVFHFASARDAHTYFRARRAYAFAHEVAVEQEPVGVFEQATQYVTRDVTNESNIGDGAYLASLNDAYLSITTVHGPNVLAVDVDTGWQTLAVVRPWIRAITPRLVRAARIVVAAS
jgi:hypothetical protein